ncbi:hypothetical protein B0H16DRAFT_1665246 [Mycena metata]|uniref:NAD(P)-binding protein n=1 Tax=Mycena metata TaxID=1033252 RepID=A0AAD7MTN5_9AGAR|nr:hypothetical protein B0H16DRAFT_1665246 [Mycena metata]
MSPSNKTVYLISGSNRGIGYGLAALIAARPDTIVFAGARDPAAQSLKDLAAKHSNVHPAAIAEIQKTAGRLDVIIANAGIANTMGTVASTPPSAFREHWEVNTLGLIVLFQVAHALLLASPTGAPIFAYISTGGASIAQYYDLHAPAYASSKAAANFLVKALDGDHPALIAMAISPGWVATEMGNQGATANGLPAAPVTVEDSVKGVMSRIDGATKEKSSGRFWNFYADKSGRPWDIPTEEIPW